MVKEPDREVIPGVRAEELSFFKDALEQLPVGVIIAAPGGRQLLTNQRARRITRCPHVSVEQDLPWDRAAPLGEVQLLGGGGWPLARTLAHGEVVSDEELEVRCCDGSEAVLRGHSFPLRGGDGELLAGVMTFSDATASRKAAQALGESEQRYRSLVEYSPEPIAVHCAGELVYLNGAGARLLGADDPQQIIGRSVLEFVPPEQVERIKARMGTVMTEGWAPLMEEQFVCLDGRTVDVEVVAVRVMYGGRLGSQLVIRDITQRKKAEKLSRFLTHAGAVLASTLDYGGTLQNVARLAAPELCDLCLVEVTDEGLHPTARALAHADPDVEGRLRRLLDPVSGPHDRPLLDLRNGEALLLEQIPRWTGDRAPQELRPLLTSPAAEALWRAAQPRSCVAVPLLARERVTGVLAFVFTESRRFSAEDLPAHGEIGRRAAVAIDNARLYRELQEADQRKDEFLAMLAHELRNPLAALSGAVEVLRGAPGQAREDAQLTADRQLATMTRLLDDLLEVSRITQGKIQLRRQPLDLVAYLRQVLGGHQALMERCGHRLEVELPGGPVRLLADPNRLEQIFSNLLNNAAKYTPPGGRIRVSAVATQGEVTVRVVDDGVGIPADVLPHIFDLFFQVERSLDRSQGGLGIGLTLVDRLVRLHGGRAEVRSDGPGQGTELVVRLPTLAEEPAEEAPRGALAARPRRPHHVLLVEDNVDVAEMLATLLRYDGHQVEVAADGPRALELALARPPEVVLLDIGLPGMDGYQVAARLRAQGGADRPLIIAVTGYGQEPSRRRAREAGFDHYLVKPVEIKRLRELLA